MAGGPDCVLAGLCTFLSGGVLGHYALLLWVNLNRAMAFPTVDGIDAIGLSQQKHNHQ